MEERVIEASNQHGRFCVPAESAFTPTAKTILSGEVHEPDTIALIVERARARPGHIVHAGTYFGDFLPALNAAAEYSGRRVYAFEPNDENWLHAVGTVHLNELRHTSVQHAALGEVERTAQVVVQSGGIALGGQSRVDQYGDQECTVVPLDVVLPREESVSVIHLDVECYEEYALAGALATIGRWRPLLILETVPWMWVREHLFELGYRGASGRVHHNTVLEAQ